MKDTKHGEFCWNELMTNDVNKSKEFYSELFGWEMEDHDMGQVTYTMLKKGDTDVGSMMQIPAGSEQTIPPHWMSYVCVKDLDAAVAKARLLGAVIKQDSIPVGEFGKLAVLQDPTGAHIALWQSTRSK